MFLTVAQRRSLLFLRAVIAGCVVLPLILFAYQGSTTYSATYANADLEIARTRDIAREHAAKVLETIERSLSEINELVRDRTDDDIRANAKQYSDRLATIDRSLPQMKSNWVIDAGGKTIANSISEEAPDTSLADRDYFAAHRDRDIGTYLGPVLVPKPQFGGLPFFSMSCRRRSADGRFAGVIQASILPDYFEQFYRQIGFEEGAIVILALADGSILASSPTFPVNTKLSPGGEIGVQLARAPDIGVVTLKLPFDGVERRLAYQKLASFPVYVAAGLSTEAIHARWRREFTGFLMIVAPGAILLVLLLWLFLRATKRIYAEAASRARAETALRENQRIEALGQLTGGVAHDFNNFLAVIGASADLLRRGNLPDERRLRYIDAITETVGRASALTGQLLAFARRQPLQSEVFDAARRIDSMADMLQTLVGASVELRIHRKSGSCLIDADASQFETALVNLAANARDAMPNGGKLLIVLGSAAALPSRFGGQALPGGYLTVAVTDTGAGIPPDRIDRVFEPFFTTKELGKGTGLGLSQVFGFARQSRGEVMVESEPGRGATFTLYVPFAVGRPAAPSPREAAAAGPDGKQGVCVLLVDDNEPLLAATGDALRARGLAVITATTGEDALARLQQPGQHVDIVLTDTVMPGMSGLDLVAQLRRRRPDLPVVVTTGYSEAIEREGVGDLVLVQKPYDIAELATRLLALARRPADNSPA